MFEIFKSRAEAVAAEVHRVGTKKEAIETILNVFVCEGVSDTPGQYASWAGCEFLNDADRDYILARTSSCKFDVSTSYAAQSRVGVSQMDWGIADTGTLVQNASAVDKRLASTLPLVHVALIAHDRIVPDLGTLLSRVTPQNAAYISLITGPSRTADIERVLTIGVHGPERLVILVVDDLKDES
jgi:L-lactate dehydrogenase complex protein LldG